MLLKKYISDVRNILNREIRSFTTILELQILEEKSLVDNNMQALSEVIEKQEDIFSSIACLEKSRVDILAKIAEQTEVAPENFTISRLAESVDGQLRKELVENGHILSGLYEDIQRKRASNTMLINQAIMLVESDIRAIFNAVNKNENKEAVYTSDSVSDNTSYGFCIDQKR